MHRECFIALHSFSGVSVGFKSYEAVSYVYSWNEQSQHGSYLCMLYIIPDVAEGLKGSMWEVSGLEMLSCMISAVDSLPLVFCSPLLALTTSGSCFTADYIQHACIHVHHVTRVLLDGP